MKGKKGVAIVLIILGSILLLDKVGFSLGHLMSYIFPLALVGLGVIGIRNGSKFFGWLLFVLGAIIVLGKMSWLIGIILAIGLIIYGASMLRNKQNGVY